MRPIAPHTVAAERPASGRATGAPFRSTQRGGLAVPRAGFAVPVGDPERNDARARFRAVNSSPEVYSIGHGRWPAHLNAIGCCLQMRWCERSAGCLPGRFAARARDDALEPRCTLGRTYRRTERPLT